MKRNIITRVHPLMVTRRVLVAVVALLTISVLFAAPASAHFLGYDSVDGSEIAFEDHTKWDDARIWAQNTWNNAGRIKIFADTWWSQSDIEFTDRNQSWVSWAGLYQYEWWDPTDEIYFNDYYMYGYTTAKRRNVAIHELGHALGLDHNSYTYSVLYTYVTSNQYLSSHDRYDLWNVRW